MLKITAILSLVFIDRVIQEEGLNAGDTAVSSVWSACDSCGSECVRACGTRRFRACCFNYLRRKRGPEVYKIHSLAKDAKDSQPKSEVPVFVVENTVPVLTPWTANELSSENHPYSLEDIFENNLD